MKSLDLLVKFYMASLYFVALSPWDTIGSLGARNFMLCKKPQEMKMAESERPNAAIAQKGGGSWKSWINKSLNLKISSH